MSASFRFLIPMKPNRVTRGNCTPASHPGRPGCLKRSLHTALLVQSSVACLTLDLHAFRPDWDLISFVQILPSLVVFTKKTGQAKPFAPVPLQYLQNYYDLVRHNCLTDPNMLRPLSRLTEQQ